MIHGRCSRSNAFFGVLIEHYAGAFPLWLATVQVAVLPITDRINEYAEKVAAELKAAAFAWKQIRYLIKSVRKYATRRSEGAVYADPRRKELEEKNRRRQAAKEGDIVRCRSMIQTKRSRPSGPAALCNTRRIYSHRRFGGIDSKRGFVNRSTHDERIRVPSVRRDDDGRH